MNVLVLLLLSGSLVDANVDVNNCDCYKEQVEDKATAALAAADHSNAPGADDHAGDDHGSGEGAHEVISVAEGAGCDPATQFAEIEGVVNDAAVVSAAGALCTEKLDDMGVKLDTETNEIPSWTSASAQECSQLCLRCGCRGFKYQNKTDGCFPGDAQVELQGGAMMAMSALKVGDVVRVGAATYSKVYMFTHKDAEVKAKFTKIFTSTGKTLRLTSGHYLYVNGKLQTARTVVVGDALSGAGGNVTAVATEWAEGFYNPHTMTGDIVVDGILTSTYTDAVAPSLAHALLWPVRMLYEAGVQVAGDDWNEGGGAWTTLASKFGLVGEDKEYSTQL